MTSRAGLVAIVLSAIALLSAVDILLARVESRESRDLALRYYDSGTRLLAAHRAPEAVEQFRKAHAMDRANLDYARRLSAALIEAGKLDEAQALLAEVLERAPNDGEANLIQGRLTARQGNIAASAAYYHRAIYGAWPDNPEAHRIQTRLELANLLASAGSKDLLAELLPLETGAHSLGDRKRIAKLFLVAGSPVRAQSAYRNLIRDDPKDKSDYAGLGEAELALGNYRAAQTAFQSAGEKQRAVLSEEMAGLDPTLRRLSSAERFRRSTRILEMARAALAVCSPADPLLETADRELKAKLHGPPTNESAEQRLSVAEQLWQSRPQCQAPEALSRLMPKLAQ